MNDSPIDVNVSDMRQVYGRRLRIDDPLLGDNPKVAAIKKQNVYDAIEKFFSGKEDDPDESAKTSDKPMSESHALLVSLFKIIMETLFRKR